jgi:hypothetical protein
MVPSSRSGSGRRRLYLRVTAKLLGWVAIVAIIYVFVS